MKNVSKYVVEFIGTFFLVLTIGCTVLMGLPNVIPAIAIGAALMVMIFAGGHISGAHFNPAVTLAVYIRGKMPLGDVLPYWAAQFAAAVAAAFAAMFITEKTGDLTVVTNIYGALLAEFLFTFALAWVVLNTATATANAGNSFYGLAIGATVMVGAFAVGRISGGAFNPAVAVGIATMKLVYFQQIWIHLFADFFGGIAAALVFKAVVKD